MSVVSGAISVNNKNFTYGEFQYGGGGHGLGNRGIYVRLEGSGTAKFFTDPNPHRNAEYTNNRHGAENFSLRCHNFVT